MVFIMAYVVGANFLAVYGQTIDTVMHLYCIDEELHKNKGMRGAHFAPAALKDFIARNVD